MANHKSAKKRIRSTKRKTQFNKPVMSALRNCKKSLSKSIESKNTKDLEKSLTLLFKLADKAEKKGVIKKNTAARYKSRLSSRAQKILSPSSKQS